MMAIGDPPVNVTQLTAKITQATGNIAKQRDAMAEVARATQTNAPVVIESEVK